MAAPLDSVAKNSISHLGSGWHRLGALASFLLAAAAMAPVVGAGFHPEDFGWLAIARRIATPWSLFAGNIPFAYYYRPLPLAFWWLSAQLFGTDASWHNLADLLLHAGNAALVCVLATRLTRRQAAGWIAGLLFACLPAGIGTAVWLSDRFDPIALMFSLLALLAFESALERWRRHSALWAGVFLLSALLSKESAYVVAGLMLARLAWHWLVRRESWPLLNICVVLAIGMAIALRLLTVTSLDASLNIGDAVHAFIVGVAAWWRQAPAALLGFRPAASVLTFAVVVLLLMTLAVLVRDMLTTGTKNLALAGTGIALLVLPALVQWPVTQSVLGSDASTAFTENLRFYYFAGTGLALLLAAGYTHLRSAAMRAIMLAGCLLTCCYGFVLAHQVSAQWAQAWRASSDANLVLGAELGGRQFPRGCRIYLDAPDWQDGLRGHADTIVKAAAAADASLQACAVFADAQVYQTLLPATQCDASQWPGMVLSERNGVPVSGRVGNLCILQFATFRLDQLGTALFRFHVDADGHIHELVD